VSAACRKFAQVSREDDVGAIGEGQAVEDGQSVWSIAAMIVAKHGIRAISFAEHQVLKARQRGDAASLDRWQSVAETTAAILRGEGLD
jgi:hypothetical protein